MTTPLEPSECTRGNAPHPERARWIWKPHYTRILAYLAVLLALVAWKFLPRPWHPSLALDTGHHLVYSTATRQQTEETAQVLDLLYTAYSHRLGPLETFEASHPRLKVKLFKDRTEFRRINRNLGWAEAFYREPYCQAYFSASEINPYHWMLHESVHQLNREVAHLKLEKWLEEGLATYFSTSRMDSNGFVIGQVDFDTYPVWWIHELAITTNLSENVRNGSVIPLRAIITNRGGPSLNREFNLYYLHWWTLTHFVFENPGCREHALELVSRGGGLEAFEQVIGPLDRAEAEWHTHVLRLKTILSAQQWKPRKAPRPIRSTSPPAPRVATNTPE